MVRSARRDLTRTVWGGLLVGLAAAVAMVSATLALRAWLGLPLPVELASDRIVPMLSIGQFNQMARRLGGLVHAKEVAFRVSLAVQFVLAVLGGVAFVLVAGWLERARAGHGAVGRGRTTPAAGLAGVLAIVFVIEMALLWPVLASNYRGLPPAPARWLAAAGLLLPLGLYWLAVTLVSSNAVAPDPSHRAEADLPSDPSWDPGSRAAISRRAVLTGVGTVAVGFAGAWLTRGLTRRATFGTFGYDGLQTRGPALDAVTPNDEFYVVTKNLIDPRIDAGSWRLSVDGLVDRPRTYRFEDIAALPAVDQPTTLECISNPVGGGLMSNAVWRGVPLRTVLEVAGGRPSASRAVFHAADGYVHTTSIDTAMNPATLLAYRMNGVSLPHRHGYPVRLIVPGTYGEVSVKWVDRIELVDVAVEGYYERQGWRAQYVNTTSRIDQPSKNRTIPLGTVAPIRGVAFAGNRGVSRVEVSTDGGLTWSPARIEYTGGLLTWVLWAYDWRPPAAGEYQLTVRATDGTGAAQDPRDHGSAPSGATGYHRVPVLVAA